jgi:hypothetical protein
LWSRGEGGGAVIGLGERIERKERLWIEGNPLNPF